MWRVRSSYGSGLHSGADAALSCGADTQDMRDVPTLSPAQARFADAHGSNGYVRPAGPDNGSVYMYRERLGCTDRWLVAINGEKLDWTLLRYAAAAA